MSNHQEIASATFQLAIQATREKFGEPPRTLGFFERMYLRIRPPVWMKRGKDSRFLELYAKRDLLYREGIIVWGHILQANVLLFKRGYHDAPAAIIYSLDRVTDGNTEILEQAAHLLYSLKGKSTHQELQQLADKLADQYVADWRIPLPVWLTKGVQCYYITTMVIRRHLPRKYLSGALFPFLVCPEKTDIGMIVPSRYWEKWFRDELW